MKRNMFSKFFEKNPDLASQIGLHDPYDFMLPKGDTALILENHKILDEFVERMKETVDYDALSDANKIDWHVLERTLETSKFQTYEQRKFELDPDASSVVGGIFFAMITRDYAPLERRIEAIIARLEKLPIYLREFRTRFEKSKPVRLWTELALEAAPQIPGLFQFITMSTKGRIPNELHEKLVKATAGLTQPLQEHIQWLEGLKEKSIDNWALGKEKFEKLVQLRGLGLTSEEIYQIGVKYLKELREERVRIAAKIAPGQSVEEAMKIIEANAPKTFEEAIEATSKAMKEAKEFVIKNKLATVHEEDKLIVEETPGFMAPLFPFAGLMMPSRFDKTMIGVYVVTRPKNITNLAKHLNYSGLRNIAVHEAFPGHFLQGAMSNRSSLIHILAQGTETTEGWAHYCEQMMMEHGFVTGLESKLIQVKDAIWRAVRIIVDVGLSRGEMGFEEAVNMLMTEAGMSKEAATAEARWYTQEPGYPMSYLLGKHLMLQLREDVKQKMGSKFSERFFHDTVTANGYLPISLLRKVFDQRINKLKA